MMPRTGGRLTSARSALTGGPMSESMNRLSPRHIRLFTKGGVQDGSALNGGNCGGSWADWKIAGERWTLASGTPSLSWAMRAPRARLDAAMTAFGRLANAAAMSYIGRR